MYKRQEYIGVVGENGVFLRQAQGFHEPLPQPPEKEEGAAQKQHLALDLAALGQALSLIPLSYFGLRRPCSRAQAISSCPFCRTSAR